MKTFTSSLFALVVFLGAGALAAGCGSDKKHVSGPSADAGAHGGSGGSGGASSGGYGGIVNTHYIPDSGDPGVIMCDKLATWCHPFDRVSVLGHRCHEAGHLGDVPTCMMLFDQCIALCHPDDAGDAAFVPLGPVCERLATSCDPFENNDGGLGHRCHELGHAGDETACIAMESACVAVCEADAGDASNSDASADGG